MRWAQKSGPGSLLVQKVRLPADRAQAPTLSASTCSHQGAPAGSVEPSCSHTVPVQAGGASGAFAVDVRHTPQCNAGRADSAGPRPGAQVSAGRQRPCRVSARSPRDRAHLPVHGCKPVLFIFRRLPLRDRGPPLVPLGFQAFTPSIRGGAAGGAAEPPRRSHWARRRLVRQPWARTSRRRGRGRSRLPRMRQCRCWSPGS